MDGWFESAGWIGCASLVELVSKFGGWFVCWIAGFLRYNRITKSTNPYFPTRPTD